jgi:4-hydroxybenzoyl-CoA thioesterase
MASFSIQKLIRFQHCDPAGIVFFPQYYQLFNEVVEDWFAQALDMDFRHYHLDLHLGCPIKKIDTEFFAPSKIGDVIDCALHATRLGGSSMSVTIRVTCAGELRAIEKETRVQVSTITNRPEPWSEALRDRIARYVVPAQSA